MMHKGNFKKRSRNAPFSIFGHLRKRLAAKMQKGTVAFKGVGGKMTAGESVRTVPYNPVVAARPSFEKEAPQKPPPRPIKKGIKQLFEARKKMAKPRYRLRLIKPVKKEN